MATELLNQTVSYDSPPTLATDTLPANGQPTQRVPAPNVAPTQAVERLPWLLERPLMLSVLALHCGKVIFDRLTRPRVFDDTQTA